MVTELCSKGLIVCKRDEGERGGEGREEEREWKTEGGEREEDYRTPWRKLEPSLACLGSSSCQN